MMIDLSSPPYLSTFWNNMIGSEDDLKLFFFWPIHPRLGKKKQGLVGTITIVLLFPHSIFIRGPSLSQSTVIAAVTNRRYHHHHQTRTIMLSEHQPPSCNHQIILIKSLPHHSPHYQTRMIIECVELSLRLSLSGCPLLLLKTCCSRTLSNS